MARRQGKNLGDVLRGVGDFLDLVSNLTEDTELSKSGEIASPGKRARAVYGFSVRMAAGGKPLVERFGTIPPVDHGPSAEEVREPMVDVFDEGDHLRLVAELPGVEPEDVRFDLEGDVVALKAVHGERQYVKEVSLPVAVLGQQATSSYRNGIFELKLPKA